MAARFRAPSGHGDVLAVPHFNALPALVDANRRFFQTTDARIGELSLRDIRAMARRELDVPDGPLLLAGHQPELSHPGVWAKNFALAGLARKVGGTGLNIIVDNDTLKTPTIKIPIVSDDPAAVSWRVIPFDIATEERPYELRTVLSPELFRDFPHRVEAMTANWGYTPLLGAVWKADFPHIGTCFTSMRVRCERDWGCQNREITVSRISQTTAFQHFAGAILADLHRFREVYNTAIHDYRRVHRMRSANHPAPELAAGEFPFWTHDANGRRVRKPASYTLNDLRPRAITLTLFARLCLGDFFIHGIGGGKYDEVTDAIMRDYFAIEPPAFQVLSGTLHLPLPTFNVTPTLLQATKRSARDLHWNPDRYIEPNELQRLEVGTLVNEKRRLIAAEPPQNKHAQRREWFRKLRDVTLQLQTFTIHLEQRATAKVELWKMQAQANAILTRRDFPWVLYPENTLRPFLQQFLEM